MTNEQAPEVPESKPGPQFRLGHHVVVCIRYAATASKRSTLARTADWAALVTCRRSADRRGREAKAVELRLDGQNYDDIAKALGLGSRASAWKAVDRALHRQTIANVEELRNQVLADAYILQESAWKAACEGRSSAIYQCFRALDLRMKVLRLAS